MERFFGLISEGDVCSTGLLILLLYLVGARMVEREPPLQSAGRCLSVAALLAALAHGGVTRNPLSAQDWLLILIRALSVAGIVLGVAWIVLSVVAFLFHHTVTRPLNAVKRSCRAVGKRCAERRARRKDERQQRRDQAQYVLSAPERERMRLLAEDEAKARSLTQERRSDARASTLLSFSFYAAKLGTRFSREMFDQYVKEYMGDERPAEVVEHRGRELISIFERHLADIQPLKKSTTIESITNWYEQTKAQIQALPLDEVAKDIRLIDLEKRFDELLAKHLEGTEP